MDTIEIAFLSINVAYEVKDDNELVKVIILFADSLQHTNAQADSNSYVIIMYTLRYSAKYFTFAHKHTRLTSVNLHFNIMDKSFLK